MSGKTFIIAEAGSTHGNDLKTAKLLCDAAKACGADAVKFQYWSSSKALADRRNVPLAEPIYAKYKLPMSWLEPLAKYCEKIGIEFMCTTYLIEDIPAVAPYVDRFKVSAYESGWREFVDAHTQYGRQVIISVRPEDVYKVQMPEKVESVRLHCISEYPCPLEKLKLPQFMDGLSDHTTSLLTGGFAVMRYAVVIEKHIRPLGCDPKNPDYGHSLVAEPVRGSSRFEKLVPPFMEYVKNIRDAEAVR